ncbi:MAG: DUF2752 domain-containing protein [Bacteroidota bacterium]
MNTNEKTKTPPRYIGYAIIAVLSIVAMTLLILPADYFDYGRPMCLSVLLLDKECYGCGMTRGIQHLIHLDFENAWHFNKLSFVVLPLFAYMTVWEIRKRFFHEK